MTTLSSATFASHYPVTGEVLAEYPITDRDQVIAAVARARAASAAWQNLGFAGRRKDGGAGFTWAETMVH